MKQALIKLTPPQKIALSFLLVILSGSLLLSLPMSQLASSQANYLDHLFIAVSAVCVTGLWTQSIHDSYNILGQIIMMILIQIGGLGLMTIIGSIYHGLGQRIELKDQITTSQALNRSSQQNLGEFLGRIIRYTAVIEGTGALILSGFFVPRLGWGRGIFNAIFTAISAFCNAGFDLMSNDSLTNYSDNPLLLITIMALIVLGGIGFAVWFDVADQFQAYRQAKRGKKIGYYLRHLKTHTKLMVRATLALILLGSLFVSLLEWHNPDTLGPFSNGHKLLVAFFESITMRTAGFSSIDYTKAHPVTLLYFIVNMFIGGGSGGTAGGLKVTTFVLTLMLAMQEVRQSRYVSYDYHTIPTSTVRSAFVLFLIYISLLLSGSALLLAFEPNVNYLYLLFESVSALATVGVSASLTPSLSTASHLVLIALMYAGRIGPMTLLLSLHGRQRNKYDIEYSRTEIIIG